MEIKTFNNDPNFSIVMRGGCNAQCGFCFNKDKKGKDVAASGGEWLFGLYDALCQLPSKFYQISITGNEPMLSADIENVMAMCKKLKGRYTNILLTTNGTNLLNRIDCVSSGVHHINVSRHHYDEEENKRIFGGSYNVMDSELMEIVDRYSAIGIDVSLNCVIDDTTTFDFVLQFVDFAKRVGANAVRFRKKNGDNLGLTPCEMCVSENYPILSKGECPVCRTYLRVIGGLKTYWKASLVEPTQVVSNEVYELVYNTDGKLYLDWGYSIPFDLVFSTKSRVVFEGANDERELIRSMTADCGTYRSSRC